MTDTLKACPTPWCEQQRGEPYVFARRRDVVGVYCPSCSVTTPYFTTEAEAVTFWNTRPEAGWQEIESAPRVHGQMILSFNRHGAMDIICWNNSTDWWDDGIYTDDAGDYPEPTHWRPLPTPPTESPSK